MNQSRAASGPHSTAHTHAPDNFVIMSVKWSRAPCARRLFADWRTHRATSARTVISAIDTGERDDAPRVLRAFGSDCKSMQRPEFRAHKNKSRSQHSHSPCHSSRVQVSCAPVWFGLGTYENAPTAAARVGVRAVIMRTCSFDFSDSAARAMAFSRIIVHAQIAENIALSGRQRWLRGIRARRMGRLTPHTSTRV